MTAHEAILQLYSDKGLLKFIKKYGKHEADELLHTCIEICLLDCSGGFRKSVEGGYFKAYFVTMAKIQAISNRSTFYHNKLHSERTIPLTDYETGEEYQITHDNITIQSDIEEQITINQVEAALANYKTAKERYHFIAYKAILVADNTKDLSNKTKIKYKELLSIRKKMEAKIKELIK